jgi:hypothetical protein
MRRQEDHQQEDHQQEDHRQEGQEVPEDHPDTPRRHHPDHHQYRNLYQQDQATLA